HGAVHSTWQSRVSTEGSPRGHGEHLPDDPECAAGHARHRFPDPILGWHHRAERGAHQRRPELQQPTAQPTLATSAGRIDASMMLETNGNPLWLDRLTVRTRSRHHDYRWLGTAPSSWWQAFSDWSDFEQPSLVIRSTRRGTEAYFGRIWSSRFD